ncbi:MAG: outer membrane lipoprotein carrier protein LolA [Myxococcota bacterium]
MNERTVAAAVQSFYNQTKGVQADFYQTYYHKLYDRYDRSRGRVVFAKPGKMRWNYSRPNGKIITSNGERLRIYEPGDEGERGQCFERAMNEDQLPQAFSFLTGTGRLEQDFRFRLLDPRRQGYEDGYVLELRPREPTPHYDRILFYVMRQDGRPSGIVRRVLIVDASGNRNRFDFSNFQWNPRVNARTFDYQPPGGITCTQP